MCQMNEKIMINAVLTRGRWNVHIGFNVYAPCWVIRWQVEVTNRNTRKIIESFERDRLVKGHIIKYCSQSGDAKVLR